MKEQFRVEKPEEVKIIQMISHCPRVNTASPSFSLTNYYKVLGLGDDNKIYEHNEYQNTWSREDLREVPDACICHRQPFGLGGEMLCGFCMGGILSGALDRAVESKTDVPSPETI